MVQDVFYAFPLYFCVLSKREREGESEKDTEREIERARVGCRKRGDMNADPKRGKESMSQGTITVVSQW